MKTEPPANARHLPSIDRRSLFKGGLLGAGLAALPQAVAAGTIEGFGYGVASGEPGPSSVLLWTRYAGTAEAVLRWEISRDMNFSNVVDGGDVTATPARDFCVKPVATGLEPGTTYYYRFAAPDGTTSEVGRTRTLPVGKVDRFRMAVFSCSNMGFGYFNAYAHAAEQNEFDLLVHTGDYFYEYQAGTYPSPDQALPGRNLSPQNEILTLAEYRLRHATYRGDPDLRRMTQLYPMILGWDDHESANDSYREGAQNHQPETEGEWDVRKAAAMRAYREWLPVSDEPYSTYEVGDLATLFRLETRLLGRDEPPSIGDVLKGKTGAREAIAALTAYREGAYRDPARSMLGMRQEAWLAEAMKSSTANGTKWQVLVQQVIMGELFGSPDILSGMSKDVPDWLRQRLQAAAAASAAGLPLNMDAWDGYPAARSRLLSAAQNADANLVVLAGDSHNAWAFELENDGAAAGVEFAGQSVCSPGFETNVGWIKPEDLARSSVAANKELAWADTSQRGYMAVELTPEKATSEYRFVGNVRQRGKTLSGTHRVSASHGARKFDS